MINVISGLPRSGTSLISNLICDAVGSDMFIGEQWRDDKVPNEVKNLNVHGFYESQLVSKPFRDNIYPNGSWTKIITPALIGSNSNYIDKVILCIRNPLTIASSRLNMRETMISIANPHALKMKENPNTGILTPEMYTRVLGSFFKWNKSRNREMPLIVDFDNINDNPREICEKISNFIGQDVNWKLVDNTQRRSKPIIDNQNWTNAIDCYGHILNDRFDEAIKIYEQTACISCKGKRERKLPGNFYEKLK